MIAVCRIRGPTRTSLELKQSHLQRQIPRRLIDTPRILRPGRQIEPHLERHDPINPLAAFLLGRLPVVGRILFDRNIAGQPRQYQVCAT